MGPTIARTFIALAAVVTFSLLPRGGAPLRDLTKTYVAFEQQAIHLSGCLDPAARERNPDVDVLRVTVERETSLLVNIRGTDGLEPGFVVTADEGSAATHGWLREIGSRGSDGVTAHVTLPAAGAYSFVIADRRELTGDEMAAGRGCFAADFQPAGPAVLQPIPLVWRGTVGVPVAFSVPKRGPELALIEVSNLVEDGILLVSVFEDKAYARSVTIGPKENARILVESKTTAGRILVEEAANWGRHPMRAMVRTISRPPLPGTMNDEDTMDDQQDPRVATHTLELP